MGNHRGHLFPHFVLLAWEQCESVVSYRYSSKLASLLARRYGAANVGRLGSVPALPQIVKILLDIYTQRVYYTYTNRSLKC